MVEIKEQQIYGPESSSTSFEVGDGAIGHPLAGDNQTASIISTTILSLGLVAALLLFVYLCFLRPDASNVVIPLIATPLFKYLLERWRERRVRTIEQRRTESKE